ncbi:hypothetical protein RvY_18294 [Ramazzottius varieornatus]|uniref:Uncharacterized protein n=1 Tax=Ramazzottius varieornatus TaxID=947166 RepID=A0A1D1W578_RAMVA|nr:hypothetical protein RvY_18294 [Ramazzottius varieornatus]
MRTRQKPRLQRIYHNHPQGVVSKSSVPDTFNPAIPALIGNAQDISRAFSLLIQVVQTHTA